LLFGVLSQRQVIVFRLYFVLKSYLSFTISPIFRPSTLFYRISVSTLKRRGGEGRGVIVNREGNSGKSWYKQLHQYIILGQNRSIISPKVRALISQFILIVNFSLKRKTGIIITVKRKVFNPVSCRSLSHYWLHFKPNRRMTSSSRIFSKLFQDLTVIEFTLLYFRTYRVNKEISNNEVIEFIGLLSLQVFQWFSEVFFEPNFTNKYSSIKCCERKCWVIEELDFAAPF